MTIRRYAAPITALACVAALAGCADDDQKTLPPVGSKSATTGQSSSPTSPASTAQDAGWTPALPSGAVSATPLDPAQKTTYDAVATRYDSRIQPAIETSIRHPMPAARATRLLSRYVAGSYLKYLVKASRTLYEENAESRTTSRLLWRSPQTVTNTRIVWDQCMQVRGALYVNGKPRHHPSVEQQSTTIVLTHQRGDWYLTDARTAEGGGQC